MSRTRHIRDTTITKHWKRAFCDNMAASTLTRKALLFPFVLITIALKINKKNRVVEDSLTLQLVCGKIILNYVVCGATGNSNFCSFKGDLIMRDDTPKIMQVIDKTSFNYLAYGKFE